jgi:dipeptidase
VATRVPDDCIAAHANQARFTTINFKDKENWMWSKDVVKFARKQGYYTGKKDEDFNFQEAYAPYDFSGLYVCEARVWSFFRKFSGDMDKYLTLLRARLSWRLAASTLASVCHSISNLIIR